MKNKLLLLEDIHNVGRKGDLVSVKPGYARNFLLPQQKALIADRSVIKIQAKLKEERAKQAIEDKKEAEMLADKLKGFTITQEVKVDAEGHMYGSVSAKNITELLEAENIYIERRMVAIDHSIRQTGVHTIPLKLKEGVQAHFNLKIIPEPGSAVLTQKEPAKQKEETQEDVSAEAESNKEQTEE